jgi:hypothetical protein
VSPAYQDEQDNGLNCCIEVHKANSSCHTAGYSRTQDQLNAPWNMVRLPASHTATIYIGCEIDSMCLEQGDPWCLQRDIAGSAIEILTFEYLPR